MPEEKQTDDIEKVLSDLKSIEPRKDALIPSSIEPGGAAAACLWWVFFALPAPSFA